jgi:hypothetical protein
LLRRVSVGRLDNRLNSVVRRELQEFGDCQQRHRARDYRQQVQRRFQHQQKNKGD